MFDLRQKYHILIDTMHCKSDSSYTCNSTVRNLFCDYSLRHGFNQIVDISGIVLMEGVYSFKGKQNHKVGQWTYYRNSKIDLIESFDTKGNLTSKIEFYKNGNVKSKMYKVDKQNIYFVKYFPDGKEIKTTDDETKFSNQSDN